jgi:thymidine kinase
MSLWVYVGPMFSNKSSALLTEVSRLERIGYTSYVFKPNVDTRQLGIQSRIGVNRAAISVESWEEIAALVQLRERVVIALDELQFMPVQGLGSFLLHHLQRNTRILLSGLLCSTELEPFPSVTVAMSMATKIIHLTAYCKICGEEAAFGICNQVKESTVLVGDDPYEPRCYKHLPQGNPNYGRLVKNVVGV